MPVAKLDLSSNTDLLISEWANTTNLIIDEVNKANTNLTSLIANVSTLSTRSISAGTGLTGGGNLTANRTISLNSTSIASLGLADTAIQAADLATVATSGDYDDLIDKPNLGNSAALNIGTTAGTVAAGDDSRIVNAVQTSRSVSTGTGLTGGGNLTANRTLALDSGSIASLALADTAVQPDALDAVELIAKSSALTGDANYIINGNFDIWQRAATQITSGMNSDDRWYNDHGGTTTKTHSRIPMVLGQTTVPGNPQYFSRTLILGSSGTSSYVRKGQRVENVLSLAGKKATLTFWAKADAARDISVDFVQMFGTGGSPSENVVTGPFKITTSTAWQKFSIVVDIPSITGKTLGTNGNDYLFVNFWMSAGSDYNDRLDNLGIQTGTFDLNRISLVEGDVSDVDDPYPRRHYMIENALCKRYFEVVNFYGASFRGAVGLSAGGSNNLIFGYTTPKRVLPSLSFGMNWQYYNGGYSSVAPTGAGVGETWFQVSFATVTNEGKILLANAASYAHLDSEL